jgi:hypothetical protein
VPRAITLRSIGQLDQKPPGQGGGPQMLAAVASFAGCFGPVSAAFGRRFAAVLAMLDLAAGTSARLGPARSWSATGVGSPHRLLRIGTYGSATFQRQKPQGQFFSPTSSRHWSLRRNGAILSPSTRGRPTMELRIEDLWEKCEACNGTGRPPPPGPPPPIGIGPCALRPLPEVRRKRRSSNRERPRLARVSAAGRQVADAVGKVAWPVACKRRMQPRGRVIPFEMHPGNTRGRLEKQRKWRRDLI